MATKTKAKKPTTKKPRTQDRDGRSNTVRKITKTGQYTYYVTIPKADLEALGWRERQKVVVRRAGNKLVVEDWKG